MFIATAITNQSKLRRGATEGAITLHSYGAVNVSRRVTINISSLRDLRFQETCSKNKKFDRCFTEGPRDTKGGISAKLRRKRFQAAIA